MVPWRSEVGSDDESINKGVPDYLFRCAYCIKLISEDAPVYMRQDHSYCSFTCRDKGLSKLYTQLKETQLQEASKQTSNGSLTALDRVRSDSSVASKSTLRTSAGTESCSEGSIQPSLIVRFGQAVLDVVLQRVASKAWGAKALRTYSSGMLWGKEFMKSNSSAQKLFEYLPEVDRYLSDVKLDTLPSRCGSTLSSEHLAALAVSSYSY